MNLPFDADDPRDADIVWRRVGAGTHWFIDSKTPEHYRVLCVTEEGKYAVPKLSLHKGAYSPLGCHYRATFHLEQSPIYSSVEDAKNACEHHRRFRVFPPS